MMQEAIGFLIDTVKRITLITQNMPEKAKIAEQARESLTNHARRTHEG
jgi:hypothetical protein